MPVNSTNISPEAAFNITFTAIPNSFLDTIAPTLNPSELRVMLYIYRHTLGFHKLSDSISYDQFLHGMVTRNRRQLDKGAGVSRNSLVAGLASLESKNLIKRQPTGKYGPVNITLQPAALYEPGQEHPLDTTDKELRVYPPKAARKEFGRVTKTVKDGPLLTPVGASDNDFETGECNSPGKLGKKPDQILDPQFAVADESQTDRDQVLSNSGVLATQNLVLTKETKIITQNKPGRKAAAPLALQGKLITENVPGISPEEAVSLVEQALANGRDQEYISRLIKHVNDSPAIRVPAAVLTTLIRSNEDRLNSVKRSGQARFSARHPASGLSDATGPGAGLPSPSGRPNLKKRIDFAKYEGLSGKATGDVQRDYSGSAPFRKTLSGETSEEPGRQMDPRLKYSLQEFDSRLAVYVRHLAVEGNFLEVGFFGAKRLPEPELAAWLSWVNIYYPEVKAIKIIDQGN